MNLFRMVSSLLLLGATILAGPNVPAQGLTALREVVVPFARRFLGRLSVMFTRLPSGTS